MKQIITILIFFINGFNLYSQNEKFEDLIISSVRIYELNPIYKEKANILNYKFEVLLRKENNKNETNITEMFSYIYENGKSEYEDNDDIRRTKMKQSICYASIALMSDKDRFEYFLNIAKYSITDSKGKTIELLENFYCGLILLDIYIKKAQIIDYQNDIIELNKYLDNNKEKLKVDFYNFTKQLIDKYRK